MLSTRETPSQPADEADVLSIVFLSDGDWLNFAGDAFLSEMSRVAGVPVHLEHVCAPPSFVLFRDVVFHDYFMPRDRTRDYSTFSRCIDTIKKASLLVVDDMIEHRFPVGETNPVYTTLSHRFHADPLADFVGVRWTPYLSNYHQLARELIWGSDVSYGERACCMNDLLAYLNVPAFRVALVSRYADQTADWEHHDPHAIDELGSFSWRNSPLQLQQRRRDLDVPINIQQQHAHARGSSASGWLDPTVGLAPSRQGHRTRRCDGRGSLGQRSRQQC